MSNKSWPMTYEGVESWLKEFKDPQDFMSAFRGKTGWTLALISTGPHGVRFQLQSEAPSSEETGTVRCFTGKDFADTTLKALKFVLDRRNP